MKYKYFYNGMPLIEYCKKNPKYRYNHITKYISVKLKEDPTRSVEDIIEEYFNKTHKTYSRYLINGMSLKRYCECMNISYDAITKEISRARKDVRYKDMNDDVRTNMIIEKYLVGDEIEELVIADPKTLKLTPNNKKDL